MAEVYNSQLDAFDLYHQFRALQRQAEEQQAGSIGPALPALGHAVAGAAGSAISNVCTYPLDLIITRLQIQRQRRNTAASPSSKRSDREYKSILDAAEKIRANEGGWEGLYAGVWQDTGKTVADSFLFFLAYNFFRTTRLRQLSVGGKTRRHLPPRDELAVGFAAGLISKFFTTPIANIVTRLQAASMLDDDDDDDTKGNGEKASGRKAKEPATARRIAQRILAEKGPTGFWAGYSASMILTLNPTLTFFFFETFKRLTVPSSRRSKPLPAWATFLLAAVSKASASTITYPFSLAKARMQVSSSSSKSRRETLLNSLLTTLRTDGPGALYQGLAGEVLKGFFSHGITMLSKDALHRLVIRLYYAALRLLRRWPGPEELGEIAAVQAREAAEWAREVGGGVVAAGEGVLEKAEEVVAKVA